MYSLSFYEKLLLPLEKWKFVKLFSYQIVFFRKLSSIAK